MSTYEIIKDYQAIAGAIVASAVVIIHSNISIRKGRQEREHYYHD